MPLDEEFVRATLGEIEARSPDPFSLDGLTQAEADLLGTVTAKGVIGNGGFEYWFEGKTREDTLAVAASFDRLGLPEAAVAMRRAVEVDAWDDLDRVIWRADWDRAALAYILAHVNELATVIPEITEALAHLERRWEAAARRLDEALALAVAVDVEACRALIAGREHAAAYARLVAAGPRGDTRAFWAALRQVAEVLQLDDETAVWNHRFATGGALVVDVEVLAIDQHGDRVLESGPVDWHVEGVLRRRRRAEVHAASESFGRKHLRINDAGRVRLTPSTLVEVGARIVMLRDGQVVARGQVVELLAPAT